MGTSEHNIRETVRELRISSIQKAIQNAKSPHVVYVIVESLLKNYAATSGSCGELLSVLESKGHGTLIDAIKADLDKDGILVDIYEKYLGFND